MDGINLNIPLDKFDIVKCYCNILINHYNLLLKLNLFGRLFEDLQLSKFIIKSELISQLDDKLIEKNIKYATFTDILNGIFEYKKLNGTYSKTEIELLITQYKLHGRICIEEFVNMDVFINAIVQLKKLHNCESDNKVFKFYTCLFNDISRELNNLSYDYDDLSFI